MNASQFTQKQINAIWNKLDGFPVGEWSDVSSCVTIPFAKARITVNGELERSLEISIEPLVVN
jgi:hypothetical protein